MPTAIKVLFGVTVLAIGYLLVRSRTSTGSGHFSDSPEGSLTRYTDANGVTWKVSYTGPPFTAIALNPPAKYNYAIGVELMAPGIDPPLREAIDNYARAHR